MTLETILYNILLPFLLALLVTAAAVPLSLRFIRKFGLMDDPKLHKHPSVIHTRPTPRGGGLPLFIGTLVASLFFLPITAKTVGIFFAALLALVIGLFDDKLHAKAKEVSPHLRFLINILCAIIVVGSGVTIPFITHPLGGILQLQAVHFPFFLPPYYVTLADIVAGIWIIWVMNMLNWSKGVDGQMPGVVAISAIVIGLLSLRFPLHNQTILIDATLSFIIAGAAIGFLFFNFYPAKIFPGYGATSLYLLLAVVSMLSGAKLATAVLVMGVPTIDAGFTILRRIFSRQSIFKGDNRHLHHILLRFGFSQRQIALFYWTISAILGAVSLLLSSKSKLFALLTAIVIVGGGLLFLHIYTRDPNEKTTT